jgi:hypothetical protein
MSAWQHFKLELREGGTTFFRWWRRTWMVWVALHVVLGVVCLFSSEGPFGQRMLFLVLIPLYGAVQGILVGLGVGCAALVCRMTGWTILVPIVLIPLAVWLSMWLGTGWIDASWDQFVQAMKDRGEEMSSIHMSCGCGSPVALLVWAPILLVLFLWSGPLWWTAFKLILLLVALLAAGVVTAAGITTPVLIAATASRIRRRARERAPGTDSRA